MIEPIQTSQDVRNLFDQQKHNVGLKDMSSSLYGNVGEVFRINDTVIKFRREECALGELENIEVLRSLGMKLPPHYAIKLDQTSLSYFNKQADIRPASHVVISSFVPGGTIGLHLESHKENPNNIIDICTKATNQMLIPSAIGRLIDPHENNFIWDKTDLIQPATLIDAELAIIDLDTRKFLNDSVTDLFQSMVDRHTNFASEQVPHCNGFFELFRCGFHDDHLEQYRQQCDQIVMRLIDSSPRKLKETGLRDILIKRALDLKKFI